MPWLPRKLFQEWPADADQIPAADVVRLYEAGFAGCKYDPAVIADWAASQRWPDGEVAAYQFGLEDTGAGKLVIPYVFTLEYYPGGLPGAAQERGDCLAAGTMVLGERVKPIEQVDIGDVVWTGEGKLTWVISKRAVVVPGPLVKICPVGCLPLTCTIDHKVLVYRMERIAGQRVNSHFYTTVKDGRNNLPGVVACYEGRHAEWVKAGDLRDTDCLLTPIDIESVPDSVESHYGLLSKDEGWFLLGYFVGNGCVCPKRAYLAVPDKSPDLLNRLVGIIGNFGLRPYAKRIKGKHCWSIDINSVELSRWLRKQFYDSSKIKVFPGWAIGNQSFLDGLQAADGFVRNDANYLDSTSLSIVYGAYLTLVKLGYEPTIGLLNRGKGVYPNAKPLYRLIWRKHKRKNYVWRDDKFLCRPIRKLEFLEGSATVYDIGVADVHHSFIANGHAISNCVSHSTKNAVLTTLCCDVASGKPDEKTGQPEERPEVPEQGIREGILSSEAFYWWRGYNGDGWFCHAAAKVATQISGAFLRQNYPELGVDLTIYSGRNAGLYGARKPPDNIKEIGGRHLAHQSTQLNSFETIRDFLWNGYGISSCGGEGYQSTRDANGVSKRSGSWAHALAYLAVDDRDVVKQAYGEPLVLILNSWGSTWNRGPRDILQSAGMVPPAKKDQWVRCGLVNPATGSLMIPEGSFWTPWNHCKNREALAFSGVQGWPAKNLPIPWIFE